MLAAGRVQGARPGSSRSSRSRGWPTVPGRPAGRPAASPAGPQPRRDHLRQHRGAAAQRDGVVRRGRGRGRRPGRRAAGPRRGRGALRSGAVSRHDLLVSSTCSRTRAAASSARTALVSSRRRRTTAACSAAWRASCGRVLGSSIRSAPARAAPRSRRPATSRRGSGRARRRARPRRREVLVVPGDVPAVQPVEGREGVAGGEHERAPSLVRRRPGFGCGRLHAQHPGLPAVEVGARAAPRARRPSTSTLMKCTAGGARWRAGRRPARPARGLPAPPPRARPRPRTPCRRSKSSTPGASLAPRPTTTSRGRARAAVGRGGVGLDEQPGPALADSAAVMRVVERVEAPTST